MHEDITLVFFSLVECGFLGENVLTCNYWLATLGETIGTGVRPRRAARRSIALGLGAGRRVQFAAAWSPSALDAAMCLLRLCAVLADGRHDDLVHVFGYALRRAVGREWADLRFHRVQ